MSNLQIKDLDPDLHAALRERAAGERLSMRDYVLRLIERDLSRPTLREWLAELATEPMVETDVDVVALLHEEREARADQVLLAADTPGAYAHGP